jgi:hypothetical protein
MDVSARDPRHFYLGTWPGLALIASDLGFKEAARKAFEDSAVRGFAFPIDAKWSLTVSYLAEVCARLGDVRRAEQLYDLLLPYRDITVIAPTATVCCGAAARYLGMLASVIGDWPRAEEHFEAALASMSGSRLGRGSPTLNTNLLQRCWRDRRPEAGSRPTACSPAPPTRRKGWG